MEAKPDMKPWVSTDKSKMSSFRCGTITRAFVLRLGSAAPTGFNKCVPIINPGLTPWAMQEYCPKGLIYVFISNQLLCCFDVLALDLYVSLIARVSACTRFNEYLVLVSVSASYSFQQVHVFISVSTRT